VRYVFGDPEAGRVAARLPQAFTERTTVKGYGYPHGERVWWPAGLERMTPAERIAALDAGWWLDDDAIVTRKGERLPLEDPRKPKP
jgi:hypothetical protein